MGFGGVIDFMMLGRGTTFSATRGEKRALLEREKVGVDDDDADGVCEALLGTDETAEPTEEGDEEGTEEGTEEGKEKGGEGERGAGGGD